MKKSTKKQIKLTIITLIGVILMGFSLTILKYVNFGTDPFSYMNLSIVDKMGWSFGTWQVILNIVLSIPVIIWGRKEIGIGTIFNMVLVGYSAEFFMWIFDSIKLASYMDNMVVRCLVMVPALALFIFSAATYMSAGMGTAPWDALIFLISKKITFIKFKWLRLMWDFTAIAVGLIFGGKLGVVTVLMAIFLGQAVTFVSEKFMKKLKN